MRRRDEEHGQLNQTAQWGPLVFIPLTKLSRKSGGRRFKFDWYFAEGRFFDAMLAGFSPQSGADIARFFKKHAENERGEQPTLKEARDYLKRKHPEIYAWGKAIRSQRMRREEKLPNGGDYLPELGK